MTPPRILPSGESLWLVVADAPLGRYGSEAIERRLQNMPWLSRCALAHEAVIEHFLSSDACVPMKLFTLFATDARAVASTEGGRLPLGHVLRRVKGRVEWGVRVVSDRQRPQIPQIDDQPPGRDSRRQISGAQYLARKAKVRQTVRESRAFAQGRANEVFEVLARRAGEARRLSAPELQDAGSTLLLDAAYLVPRSKGSAFCVHVKNTARRLVPDGYRVVLSGPWPPYNFV